MAQDEVTLQDKTKRKGVQNGMDAIIGMVREIEKLSGKKVDFSASGPLADPKQLRAEETAEAARELSERQLRMQQEFIRRTRESGHIDPAWTFKSLLKDPANQKAISDAELFCQAHLVNPEPPSLVILAGAGGSGKSVLCHAIANLWLENTHKDVCIVSPSLLEKTRVWSSNEDWSETQRRKQEWQRYLDADLLLLDGLCENSQGLSNYMQKVIPELIRTRRANNLSMVITINLPDLKFLSQAVGPHCFESFKEYQVILGQLMGGSRRKPITLNGVPLG